MSTREEAQELLNALSLCRPRAYFSKVDEAGRGTGFVLTCLRKAAGVVTAGDLAKEMNVSTARVAALLKKMEKNGYVTRSGSSRDGRLTVVAITPAGEAYQDEIWEHILEKTERLIEKVGRKDLEEFIRISGRIKAALEE